MRAVPLALFVLALSCSASTGFPVTDSGAPADTSTKTDAKVPGSDTSAVDTGVDPEEDTSTGADTGSAVDTAPVDTGPTTVSLKALQDPTDPAHPALNERVVLSDTDLVALTPRVLVGSSSATSCRFAVWIGKPAGGNLAGIQVQEVIERGAAASCFATTPAKLPADVEPGARVTAVDGAFYGEFCAGPTGTPMGMCRDWEQSQLFLGGMGASITFGSAGATPTATTVTVADLVSNAAGNPGPRALALEGTLVRVNNVRVVQETSGSFKVTYVTDASDTAATKKLEIQVSNFIKTACVRDHFTAMNGMSISSISGVLVPDFGRWKIRLRDEKDVSGLVCMTGDAG